MESYAELLARRLGEEPTLRQAAEVIAGDLGLDLYDLEQRGAGTGEGLGGNGERGGHGDQHVDHTGGDHAADQGGEADDDAPAARTLVVQTLLGAGRMLAEGDKPLKSNRVGILGLTFKENVPDLRNSRVPDIVEELRSYGIQVLVHDPLADAGEAMHEYGIALEPLSALHDLDALVLAVPHRDLLREAASPQRFLREGGALVDVKAALKGVDLGAVRRWSL